MYRPLERFAGNILTVECALAPHHCDAAATVIKVHARVGRQVPRELADGRCNDVVATNLVCPFLYVCSFLPCLFGCVG